jgi:hypothetical protein
MFACRHVVFNLPYCARTRVAIPLLLSYTSQPGALTNKKVLKYSSNPGCGCDKFVPAIHYRTLGLASNHPELVKASNHPELVKASNHPELVKASNHPELVEASNHPELVEG